MILESISPLNFGPFQIGEKIKFENNLTILTGENDSGKTSILEMIKLMNLSRKLSEMDINYFAHQKSPELAWDNFEPFGFTASFIYLNRRSLKRTDRVPIPEGSPIEINFNPIKTKREIIKMGPDSSISSIEGKIAEIIDITKMKNISEMINLQEKILENDKNFLDIAFDGNFNPEFILKSDIRSLRTKLRQASERLTSIGRTFLPETFHYYFEIERKEKMLLVSMRDRFGTETSYGMRGDGSKKMIAVMATLLGSTRINAQYYVICDEPENSLHPAAQRSFRKMLEELADKDNFQIFYSTHSPIMINNLKPQSVRLITRFINDDKTVSARVNNEPIEKNLQPVRDALGSQISDTLIYSQIVVIVEGKTESICLPIVLRKLCNANIENFSEVKTFIEKISFLDASMVGYWSACKVVKSYGSEPIFFLDEDQKIALNKGKETWKEEETTVPQIFSNKGEEFEDIVPKEKYFEALSEIQGNESLSFVAMNDWWKNKPNRPLFSKQVSTWLKSLGEKLYKPLVMRTAIEKSEPNEIKIENLIRLVEAIKLKLNI